MLLDQFPLDVDHTVGVLEGRDQELHVVALLQIPRARLPSE